MIVCALAWVAPVAVRAAEPDGHALLQRGIALQRDASWNASIAALERARASGLGTAAERAECAFYLAAAYLAINSDGAARRELAIVLDERPGFESPPYTSPKLASLFGEVTRERSRLPVLDARPPRRLQPDETRGSGLEALLRHQARAQARLRRGAASACVAKAELRRSAARTQRGPGDPSSAEVRPSQPGVLEYYADALEPDGRLACRQRAVVSLELLDRCDRSARGGKHRA